jgi:hypothetical protein
VKQSDLHQLWVHRTLSGAEAGVATNSLLSGIAKDAATKIHRTVRCAPDCSVCTGLFGASTASTPTVGSSISAKSTGDAWPEPTVTRPHRTVWCTKGTTDATVGFAKQGKKSCIVHVQWCTGLSCAPTDRRQELPTKWSSNDS